MQGTIEQSIGLVVSGNAFLQGLEIGRFWPDSPIFLFCREVRFVMEDAGAPRTLGAEDPLGWFRALAREKCTGLRLHVVARDCPEVADWMTVALVGGGSQWRIETVGCDRPSSWSDDWTFADGPSAQEQSWSVTYRGVALGRTGAETAEDLNSAELDLDRALAAILVFARRIQSHFADHFERAQAILAGRSAPDRNLLDRLGPHGFLSSQAERLLSASGAAWVFGGMGAWNDGAYDGADSVEGDRLTTALFDALQTALAAAANSTCRAGTGSVIDPRPSS